MQFTLENALKVMQDRKTQTRRRVKSVDTCDIDANGNITAVYRNGRVWAKVDQQRVVQPGRGKPGWFRDGQFIDPAIYAAWKALSPLHYKDEMKADGWRQSRIQIVAIRREQLQDISDADILAEGIGDASMRSVVLRVFFWNLWDSINKPKKTRWAWNPKVWVLVFKRVESEERIRRCGMKPVRNAVAMT